MKNRIKEADGRLRLMVSTEESGGATFNVSYDTSLCASASNTGAGSHSVNQSRTTVVDLCPELRTLSYGPADRNNGVLVQADGNKTISVYGENTKTASSDAFLALPSVEYTCPDEYTYILTSTTNDDTAMGVFLSSFLLVAWEADTTINISVKSTARRIFPPSDIKVGSDPFIAAVDGKLDFNINLKSQLSTFYYSDQNGLGNNPRIDLSGSYVKSNKPLSVFTGHQCGRISPYLPFCDHLVEQIPPTVTYGQLFLGVPLNRGDKTLSQNYAIVVSQDNTLVNFTCSKNGIISKEETKTVNTGGKEVFSSDFDEYCCIESSGPASVIQFARGSGNVQSVGDPFMVIVPPVEQYSNRYTVRSIDLEAYRGDTPTAITLTSYINLAFHESFLNSGVITVDGVEQQTDSFSAIRSSSGSIIGYGKSVDITADGFNTDHNLVNTNSSAPFSALVYAWHRQMSAGYPAGFGLDPIARKLIATQSRFKFNLYFPPQCHQFTLIVLSKHFLSEVVLW